MNRRDFIVKSAQAAGGLGLVGLAGGLSACASTVPLFKISLAEWSLHNLLDAGTFDHLDFARSARNDYGLDAVEYVNRFFRDKGKDRAYLREMKTRADGEGVRSLLIMCDTAVSIADPDEGQRIQAVENHYQWVEAAKFLGCHTIRVNVWSSGSYTEQMAYATDGLRRLTEFGAVHDINVVVENHGGLSSNIEWLIAVIKGVDHPRCGTLPDFGNFTISEGEEYDRYRGVEAMMPYAKGVSAKASHFDEQGNDTDTDFKRMLKIVLDAGYHGYVGIEYSGGNLTYQGIDYQLGELSDPDGIRATRDLLLRVREELAETYA
ncbi:MAG: sugar phosphate isomerase/epimerase [Candidatus Marinimicrobia bacterium]|nr:sugar phosphate isomerase/epimerase [Candidatus Neomarinimicrobiota bacterium]